MAKDYSKHSKPVKKRGFFGWLFRLIGYLLLIVVLLVAGMIGYLSVTEYKPEDRVAVDVVGEGTETLAPGDSFSIMTWNIGYGALGDNADFFMDGGTGVKTADFERVSTNLEGVITELRTVKPDIVFLQEADQDSTRSEHVDEVQLMREAFPEYSTSFANNFKVAFLPYPIPPIGQVDSGVMTLSSYGLDSSERVQLPIPFKWPIRMANLKRCVLVSRIKLEGSDKELVLMDLHLEAYDNGEGKIAQIQMLAELLQAEAEKGNYVIAGGDFNQIFSSADTGAYPAQEGMWTAGEIDVTAIEGDWQFLMDSSVPSCRSLDRPYEGADHDTFQYYLIDGFIVSGNIRVDSLANQDLGFEVSDHNPVLMQVTLLK